MDDDYGTLFLQFYIVIPEVLLGKFWPNTTFLFYIKSLACWYFVLIQKSPSHGTYLLNITQIHTGCEFCFDPLFWSSGFRAPCVNFVMILCFLTEKYHFYMLLVAQLIMCQARGTKILLDYMVWNAECCINYLACFIIVNA